MSREELELWLDFANDPLKRSATAFQDVLASFESHGFVPTKFNDARGRSSWLAHAAKGPTSMGWRLGFSRDSDPSFSAGFAPKGISKSPIGHAVTLTVALVDLDIDCSRRLADLIVELCAADNPIRGYGHDFSDMVLAEDPRLEDSDSDVIVHDAYWLLVFGKAQVDELGRKRVLSTPAHRVEKLPQGGVVIVTTPSPRDVISAASREAQAAVLAHLRPDITEKQAIAGYAKRDKALAPVERDWDPVLAPVLELIVAEFAGADLQSQVTKFNGYHPPPVAEVQSVRSVDTENAAKQIRAYGSAIEELIVILHDQDPKLGSNAKPAVLPRMDCHFYRHDYPGFFGAEKTEKLRQPLGAWLGDMLVRHLGGTWVPRKKQDEIQVVIGDRAYLPLLRARRYLQSKQAVLDYSLTQFFADAESYARSLGKRR